MAGMPIVMTIDQRGSRGASDRVAGLLATLEAGAWDTALPFLRTVGDECQGVPAEPLAAVDITLMLLREGHWSVGIGVGSITVPVSGRTVEASGPGFYAAREAVEAAKGDEPPLQLRGEPHTPLAQDVDALLRVLARLAMARTPTQWAVVDAVRRARGNGAYTVPRGAQKGAAAALGVTPQAVSKAYRASGWEEEYSARLALAHLLGRLDDEVEDAHA